MLGGFGGASKDRRINGRLTNLCLIGGVDCANGYTPDLTVRGGARIKKTLCVVGASYFKTIDVSKSAVIHQGLTVFGETVLNGNLEVLGDTNFNFNNLDLQCGVLDNVDTLNVNNINVSCGGNEINILSNVDMQCNTFSNVMAMHVGNLFGKSPIQVHDNFHMLNTLSGGRITWEGGIQIGNLDTSANSTNSICIGKGSKCTNGSIAIGTNSGNIMTGSNQIVIGTNSGKNLDILSRRNIMVGYNSGQNIVDGIQNTIIGYKACEQLGNSIYGVKNTNVIIGAFGMQFATGGSENTCVGGFGLSNLINGSGNQALGFNAGNGITSGNNNVCVGDFTYVQGNSNQSICIGTTSYCNYSRSLSIGAYAQNNGYGSIAIGFKSATSQPYGIQLGEPSISGYNANLKFRTQQVSSESWIGGGITPASIDNNGSIIRGSSGGPSVIIGQGTPGAGPGPTFTSGASNIYVSSVFASNIGGWVTLCFGFTFTATFGDATFDWNLGDINGLNPGCAPNMTGPVYEIVGPNTPLRNSQLGGGEAPTPAFCMIVGNGNTKIRLLARLLTSGQIYQVSTTAHYKV